MGCDELLQLLNTEVATVGEQDANAAAGIMAHLRSCLDCNQGIVQVSESLVSKDVLTCEQCRARFPTYYEATHSDHPLVTMSPVAMIEVAIHLACCSSCSEQYAALVELWRSEENEEWIDRRD